MSNLLGMVMSVSNIRLGEDTSVTKETGLAPETFVALIGIYRGIDDNHRCWMFRVLGTTDALVIRTGATHACASAQLDKGYFISPVYARDIVLDENNFVIHGVCADAEEFFENLLSEEGITPSDVGQIMARAMGHKKHSAFNVKNGILYLSKT